MAKSKGFRNPVILEHKCEKGTYRYHTSKNRRNTIERLVLKKYSPLVLNLKSRIINFNI